MIIRQPLLTMRQTNVRYSKDQTWENYKTSRKVGKDRHVQRICLFVCWCFEPSQSLGAASGLNTNSNLSLSYSAHKSFNINHNISTAQLFQTHTHTKSHIFLQNLILSISQLPHFSKQNLLQNTVYFIEHTNLLQVVFFSSPDSHFEIMNTKSLLKIVLSNVH